MSKLDEIERLLETMQRTNKDDPEHDFDTVDDCIASYVDYHNEAVNQGRLITMARFRLDDMKFADYIAALHEKRKDMHEKMIDRTSILNGLCEKYGLPKIYSGQLDQDKGRADDDTRFGVAEFAERLCHDFFRTTHETSVSEKSRAAYEQHAQNIREKSEGWSTMQRMLEKMDAQAKMDSSTEMDY